MSELTLTVLRLGLLALLWVFVFAVVGVLRADLYGTRVSRRKERSVAKAQARAQQRAAVAAARPGTPSARGIPTILVVTEGRLAGTTIPLTSTGMIIGRNPESALVLDDDFASGRHARLFQRDGGWWVEDLGSTNGSFLGGARLTTAQPVTLGSILRIGRTVLEFQA